MFCTQCGEQIVEKARFCKSCGQLVQQANEDRKVAIIASETTNHQEPQSASETVTRYANPKQFEGQEETAIEKMEKRQAYLTKRPLAMRIVKVLYRILGLLSFFGIYLFIAGDASVMSFSWYGLTVIVLWCIGFFAVGKMWNYSKVGYALTILVAASFVLASIASFALVPSVPLFAYLVGVSVVYGLVLCALLSKKVSERFLPLRGKETDIRLEPL